MKGFLTGSLALIVLYAITSESAADKLGIASTTLQIGMQRFMSPDVPLIRDYSVGKAGYVFGNPKKFNYFYIPKKAASTTGASYSGTTETPTTKGGNLVPASTPSGLTIQNL